MNRSRAWMGLLVVATFFSPSTQAELRYRWLSIAGMTLSDGETTLVFDPVFTRPGLLHWMGLARLKPTPEEIGPWLDQVKLKKADGIFVSHEHFDHSVDTPIVAKLTGATIYADPNLAKIAGAYQDPAIQVTMFEPGKPVRIGKFEVTPYPRDHSHIRPIGIHFLPWPIGDDFDFGFYDYHLGQNFYYFIRHPEGNILLDQSGSSKYQPPAEPIRALFQGIANRESDDAFIGGYLTQYQPKTFVPLHYDNFFWGAPNEVTYLPGIGFERIKKAIETRFPKTEFVHPVFGKEEILK